MDSYYDDNFFVNNRVNQGDHRDVIGGMWEEIGYLQFEFLKLNGLEPENILLDIGCGSLRGGVHFVRYLNEGNYWGVDSNQSLLDAGYSIELEKLGIRWKLPKNQLICNQEFNFKQLGGRFNFAIAQSLFTHLSMNRIRLCFHRLAEVMEPGGKFFATYFRVGEGQVFDESLGHPGGVTTYGFKDPFHYRISDLEYVIQGLPWRLDWTGGWQHPRDQMMAIFERVL